MMKLEYLLVLFLIISCINSGENAKGVKIAPETEQVCIERIFEQDSILGGIRNHAPETVTLSEAIDQYINSLESLDFTSCPPAFVNAFQQHIQAWKEITTITDNHPALRGEMHDVFDKVEQTKDSTEFKARLKEIWDTWALVEKRAEE